MLYQVTATRRRPRRFEDLLGQQFVAATLQKSIEAKKIAPAYLFSGPRGCGKTSTARILATALNCESGPTPTPCGTCSSCQEITSGTHLDVIEIDGASNTGVNDVRKIKDEIMFAPNNGRYKIYIIDEVHMLSTSAFNALLKTIEEPPAHVVFMFATTELHKVPATIKSRCQQFNFKLVSIEDLFSALKTTCEELNISAEDEALYWVAHQATGSVRDAYTLFDQVAAFSDGSIRFDLIQDKLGLTAQESITQLIDAAATEETASTLNLLDSILDAGVSIEQCTSDLGEYMRSLLMIKHGITSEAVLGRNAERFSKTALEQWSKEQIAYGLELCLQLFKDLRFSLNPRYEMELLIVRLSQLGTYVSQKDLKRAFDKAQAVLRGETQSVQAQATTPRNSAQRPLQDEKKKTSAFAESLGRLKNSFSETAQQTPKLAEDLREKKTTVESLPPESADTHTHQHKNVETPAKESTHTETSSSIATHEKTVHHDTTNTAEVQETRLPQIDFENLQDFLVEHFDESNKMLSTLLKKSHGWKQKNNTVSFYVATRFDFDAIKQKNAVLQGLISTALGIDAKIELKTDEEYREEERLPPEKIRMICEQFGGEITSERIKGDSDEHESI